MLYSVQYQITCLPMVEAGDMIGEPTSKIIQHNIYCVYKNATIIVHM